MKTLFVVILVCATHSTFGQKHSRDSAVLTILSEKELSKIAFNRMDSGDFYAFLLPTKPVMSLEGYREMSTADLLSCMTRYTTLNDNEVFFAHYPSHLYYCLKLRPVAIVIFAKIKLRNGGFRCKVYTTTLSEVGLPGFNYMKADYTVSMLNGRWVVTNSKIRKGNFIKIIRRM